MRKTPSHLVPTIYTAVALAGAGFAVAGGTSLPMVLVGGVVAVIAGLAAVVAWRRATPIGRSSIQTAHWWQLALAGPVLIGAVVLAAGAGVEAWELGILTAGLGIMLTATGLLLGLVRLFTHRPPTVSA